MSEIITEPSICIPRTLNNITWRQVKDTFELLIGRGTVERVDIVSNRNSEPENQPFCRIFVHFRYWPNTPDTMAIRQRLIDGEVLKVVYDNPWFWKCSASRVPKPVRDQPKSAPYIEFTGQTAPMTPAPPPGCATEVTARCLSPPPVRRSATVRARTVNTSSTVCNVRQPDFTMSDGNASAKEAVEASLETVEATSEA